MIWLFLILILIKFMESIILAAGSGTRLGNLTKSNPKCMVKVKGKSLIEYQLDVLKLNGFENINIVCGYEYKKIKFKNIRYFLNKKYAETNMVYSLFCAKEILNSGNDVIISYGDILYNNEVLKRIVSSTSEINIAIDLDWQKYWDQRMDDPLSDAETLKFDEDLNILEIGKKPKSLQEIQGQYIGLIKLRSDIAMKLHSIWEKMDREILYDSKTFSNMYMTSFLQYLIQIGINLKGVPINGGWAEIDTPSDIIVAESLLDLKKI